MESSGNSTPQNGPVTIYTESNPNPNSMKFVANFMLVDEGASFDFPDQATAKNTPLAKALFENFDFIDRVFFMNNFVTVTKTEAVGWEEVRNQLAVFIKNFLSENRALLKTGPGVVEQQESTGDEGDIINKIKDVLDEYIKPAVEMDGGAITFDSFDNGVVKVLLQGSCSGCPSSTITLKAGIESLLKRAIPEVESVEAANM